MTETATLTRPQVRIAGMVERMYFSSRVFLRVFCAPMTASISALPVSFPHQKMR